MSRTPALRREPLSRSDPAPGGAEPARARSNDPARTRADILDVATRHFSCRGLSGSRVDEIAEQTNTSKRMLYYYFGSKDGLYRAVLARCYGGIRAHERALRLETLPPRDALVSLVEQTFDYHDAHPDFVRIVMVENIHRGQSVGTVPGIDERGPGALAQIAALLDRGVAEGAFRTGIDPLELHLTMSGLCFYNISNRYTVREIFGCDTAEEGARARRRAGIVDVILRWVSAAA